MKSIQTDKEGYVYLLALSEYENVYKIGRAVKPANRIDKILKHSQLDCSHYYTIFSEDYIELETTLLNKFLRFNYKGTRFAGQTELRFISESDLETLLADKPSNLVYLL